MARVKAEQPPRAASLYRPNPGMHRVIVEKMPESYDPRDQIEKYEDLGYKIVSDATKRIVAMEIPEEDFLAKEKAQHDRCSRLERAKAVEGSGKDVVVSTLEDQGRISPEDFSRPEKEDLEAEASED